MLFRSNATRWAAQAEAATDPGERARLLEEASGAASLADLLNERTATLRGLDDQRATWLVHTAATRAAADRAQAELTARHAGDDSPDQRVTAEEWMAADADATREDDLHREITEADMHDDVTEQPIPDVQLDDDLRGVAAAEPAQEDEHLVRVPSAAETTDSITRARRAILEMRNRDQLDATHEAEHARSAQLARWRDDARGAEREHAAPTLDATDY